MLVTGYLRARDCVIASGYAHEIDWQDQCCLEQVDEAMFLSETAWVILSSGMRERVVRNRFPAVSEAFLYWSSAAEITRQRGTCVRAALQVFRHPAKIAAIACAARMIASISFDVFRAELQRSGLDLLEQLPFIGPVTRFHLAKNLGMDVVKPDRHLRRLAAAGGFDNPSEMCEIIANITGDRVATVDLVFWRYATLNPEYTRLFDGGHRSGLPYTGSAGATERRSVAGARTGRR